MLYKYFNLDRFLRLYFAESASDSIWWVSETQIDSTNKPQDQGLDLSKYSPEDRERIEQLLNEIKKIESEIADLNMEIQVLDNKHSRLRDSIDTSVTFEELQSDPEVFDINEQILKLNDMLLDRRNLRDELKRAIVVMKESKLSKEELSELQTISSSEFLNKSHNERLKYVTIWNIDASLLKEWWVSEVEFTFTYDGQFNRELYNKTTAGQVLPPQVWIVESSGIEYTRIWATWEYFSENWRRLIIHEWTNIDVTKFYSNEELWNIQKHINDKWASYMNTEHKNLALMSIQKWLDPDMVISLLWDDFKDSSNKSKIETTLTDISRAQDRFVEWFNTNEAIDKDGKFSEKFMWYLVSNFAPSKLDNIASKYSFDKDIMSKYQKVEAYGWPIDVSKVDIKWLDQAEINEILSQKSFRPWSKEAVVLFTAAAQVANLPKDWWGWETIHRILARESNGWVWRLNYTIQWMSPDDFKQRANSSMSNNPIWTRSTASWLGQLLLSNVDKYYPDGRRGIWDALNEAVGMLRYIQDRYGNPDIAWSVYGRIWDYNHPTKWYQRKQFKEWY